MLVFKTLRVNLKSAANLLKYRGFANNSAENVGNPGQRLEKAYLAIKELCNCKYSFRINLQFLMLHLLSAKKLPKDVNIKAVFACNELDLKEVNVYGFDYDYTLACYKPSMDYLLYNLARQTLIEQYRVSFISLSILKIVLIM